MLYNVVSEIKQLITKNKKNNGENEAWFGIILTPITPLFMVS